MLDGISEAIGYILTANGLLMLLCGSLLGMIVAILPGIGIPLLLALLIPLTIGMEKEAAMILLVSGMGAAGFAGSITSILFNVPGDGINAATCLDGYPLARQGRAGMAIAAASTASATGALFGILVLILALPIVRTLVLAFGPAEFFALSVAGLALIASISGSSPLKGLVAAMIGMTLGFVGQGLVSSDARYTFGLLQLYDGIPLVPTLIGLFAIPEMFELLRARTRISDSDIVPSGDIIAGIREVARRPALVIRSSLIGTGIGMLPGMGATVASWAAYFAAQRGSKDPDSFGKGNVEGVIAPEAAMNAKEGGSLLPTLAFGVPGGLATAILLSAFLLHGITPGQRLLTDNTPLVWAMILALSFSNVVTSLIGMAIGGQLARLTLVPVTLIAPFILVLSFVGAYGESQALFDVWLALGVGALGIVMRFLRYPVPPLIVGLILVPLIEEYFSFAIRTNRGSVAFLLEPLPLLALIGAAASLVYPWLLRRRRKAHASAPTPAAVAENHIADSAFLAATLLVIVVFLLMTGQYEPAAQLFPLIVMIPFAITLIIALGRRLVGLATGGSRGLGTIRLDPPVGRALAAVSVLPVAITALGMLYGNALFVGGFLFLALPNQSRLARSLIGVATGLSTAAVLVAMDSIFHLGMT